MAQTIIGAFSEEQVSRLTGLSVSQLRRWSKSGFIRPEYESGETPRVRFARIYSFRDLLKLRVLNQLRNVFNVPFKELRSVERKLSHLGDEKWISQKLWVHNRRVVFEEPDSSRKREISSNQFVAEIPLEVVTSDAREDIRRMNLRNDEQVGRYLKKKQIHSSDEVFSGTRIPVKAIIEYIENGFSDKDILRKFPDLYQSDIDVARDLSSGAAA